MEKRVILNRDIRSFKFGVTFPKDKEFSCYVDTEKRIFVQHPVFESVYMRVEKDDIKESNFNLD